uniref:ANK_REP_REGION domain-containing protein n=1 Tax=Macrostomum lignano TaxID=282301 RepID=A0A1I8F5A5_9PLAT
GELPLLFHAIRWDLQPDLIRVLMSELPKYSTVTSLLDRVQYRGSWLLHWAVLADLPMDRLLLLVDFATREFCALEIRPNGQPPLHKAVLNRDGVIVRHLWRSAAARHGHSTGLHSRQSEQSQQCTADSISRTCCWNHGCLRVRHRLVRQDGAIVSRRGPILARQHCRASAAPVSTEPATIEQSTLAEPECRRVIAGSRRSGTRRGPKVALPPAACGRNLQASLRRRPGLSIWRRRLAELKAAMPGCPSGRGRRHLNLSAGFEVHKKPIRQQQNCMTANSTATERLTANSTELMTAQQLMTANLTATELMTAEFDSKAELMTANLTATAELMTANLTSNSRTDDNQFEQQQQN